MRNQGAEALKFVMAEMLDEFDHINIEGLQLSLVLDGFRSFRIRVQWVVDGELRTVEGKRISYASFPDMTMTNLLRDVATRIESMK